MSTGRSSKICCQNSPSKSCRIFDCDGSSGLQAKLFLEQLASSSHQEISDFGESDVDVCESVLAEDSGGEDCEYLYKCPFADPRRVEYVSLRDYNTRTQFGFYAPANELSSDDAHDEE